MKKIFCLIAIAIICISCEDVVELETPTGETRLNIDAHFRVFTGENPIRTEGQVVLTETVNFFDEAIPAVSGALVTITERETGSTYFFQEVQAGSGIYQNSDLIFLNDFEATFELSVQVGDQQYTATAALMPSAPIIDVQQGDLEIFSEEDLEIIVTISDTPNRDDFYLFDFGFALYEPIDDEFFDGNNFEFSFLYTEDDEVDLQAGDVITVTNDGIDQQFFEYMELLLEQTQGGAIFSSPPATVRGNIVNADNPDNFPYGYFRISEAVSREFTILED